MDPMINALTIGQVAIEGISRIAGLMLVGGIGEMFGIRGDDATTAGGF